MSITDDRIDVMMDCIIELLARIEELEALIRKAPVESWSPAMASWFNEVERVLSTRSWQEPVR